MIKRQLLVPVLKNAETGEYVDRNVNSATLSIDFVNKEYKTGDASYFSGYTFEELFTFSRATSAYYWTEDGDMVEAAVDEPRFDHDPETGERRGLLLEGRKENLFEGANLEYDAMGGSDGTSTISQDLVEVPPSTAFTESCKVIKNGTRSNLYRYRNHSTYRDRYNTFSFFAKPGPTLLSVGSETSAAGWFYFRYTIDTDTLSTGGGNNFTSTVKKLKNGWLKLTTTSEPHAGASDIMVTLAIDSTSDDNSAYYNVIGWQLEEGKHSTSFIPTTVGGAIREADYLSINDSSWVNPEEGTWVIEGEYNEGIPLYGSGQYRAFEGKGKLVFTYSAGVIKCWANGSQLYSLPIEDAGAPTSFMEGIQGWIQNIQYSASAFSDAQAAQVSSGILTLEFDPIDVFSSVNDGVITDMIDPRLMYQDHLGEDLVVADGDPVGLIVNKAGWFNKGNELIVNQTFDSDLSSWTIQAGTFTQSGGRLVADDTAGIKRIIADGATMISGDWYILEWDQYFGLNSSSTDNTKWGVWLPGESLINAGYVNGEGHKQLIFKAPASGDLYLYSYERGMEYDNITLKALPGAHAYQDTTASKPTYRTDGFKYWVEYDGIDDFLQIDVPTGGWTGPYAEATIDGYIRGEVSIPAGVYSMPINPAYTLGTSMGLTIHNGALTTTELDNLQNYYRGIGLLQDFEEITSMLSAFRGRTEITSLDPTHWRTLAVANFQNCFRDCTNLASIDVSGFDMVDVTTMSGMFAGCSSLTTLDTSSWVTTSLTDASSFLDGASSLTALNVSGWNTSGVTTFEFFVRSCSSISSLDLSNWVTSSVSTFASFAKDCTSLTTVTINGGTGSPFSDSTCINYTEAFTNTNLTQQSIDDILVAIDTAATNTGTFDQSGGSAPSVTGQTAIDNLRARGWTVTVTGGY